jgi:acetolactate synthase regulatory subunit
MDGLDVKEDLTITERPIRILDRLTRVTRNRTFTMCKVQWSNHAENEATWEREVELRAEYPHLFDPSESRGRDSS